MDDDCRLFWTGKKKLVTNRLARPFPDVDMIEDGKAFRFLSFDSQPARIICKVLKPAVKLACSVKDVVVVVARKEEPLLPSVFFAATMLRHSRTGTKQLPIGLVTASLETLDNHS